MRLPPSKPCKKVPTGRHVRTVGTPTGKFGAESVRGRKAECMVQRQILSPGTAKLRRVLRTKQPKRSRGSGLPFASPLRRAQQKQGTATTRGKEFLTRDCAQKWVPPKAWRFCGTLSSRSVQVSAAFIAAGRKRHARSGPFSHGRKVRILYLGAPDRRIFSQPVLINGFELLDFVQAG